MNGGWDSSATELVNGGDGEDDAEGTSDEMATEIGEANLMNIGGEAADDGETANDGETGDDGTLAAGGAEAGVKLIMKSGSGSGAAAAEDAAVTGGNVVSTQEPPPMTSTGTGITAAPRTTYTTLLVPHPAGVGPEDQGEGRRTVLAPWRKKHLTDWMSDLKVRFTCTIPS